MKMADKGINQENATDEIVQQFEEMETDEQTIEAQTIDPDQPSASTTEANNQVSVERTATFLLKTSTASPLEANVYFVSWNKAPADGSKKESGCKWLNWLGTGKGNKPGGNNSGGGGGGDGGDLTSNLRFEDCGGLGKQISFIRTAIIGPLTSKGADQYQRFGLEPPKGILFYGAPGTGKTRLAQALSREISEAVGSPVHFIYRKGNDIASKYFGESSANLRQVFDEAKRRKPSVLFFDELDGLCPSRDKAFISEAYVTIVTTMLGLMDEVHRGEIFVIGATNRMDDIDPALRRPGRFDKCLEFLPPTEQGRQEILTIHTNKWKSKPSAEVLTKMSQETPGFSGADLAKLCLDAFDRALNREIKSEKEKKHVFTYANVDLKNLAVTDNDWKLALSKIKPSTVGVFGSTQYVPQTKAASAEIVQLLIKENFQTVKKLITSLLPKHNQAIDTNLTSKGIVQALYIWSESESCLSNMDDFIIAPLFGSHGGEEMSGYAKYCLSSETLYSTEHHNWPKKVNATFSQAIASHLPSILYVPDVHELCDAIASHHLTESVNLKNQLERLRDTHVLLVVTGTSSPDALLWNNPFKDVLATKARTYQMQRPSDAERAAFFHSIPLPSNYFDAWSNDEKLAFAEFFQRIMKMTKDQEVGSILALYDSIRCELVYGAANRSPEDILKSFCNVIASFEMNRALMNSSLEADQGTMDQDDTPDDGN